MIRPVHPFPARMAPDIAIAELKKIARKGVVLDPMAGSGTVLRQASELGHRAIGFDMDPLAVLMARVATTPVPDMAVEKAMRMLQDGLTKTRRGEPPLPWMDGDEETTAFVNYWFGIRQRRQLRRIAYGIGRLDRPRKTKADSAAIDVLKIAFSRIIITKDSGASLARDVSHSRPHKVANQSDFDVMAAFERSVKIVRGLLADAPPPGNVEVNLGDVRSLRSIANASVDVVLTSPPYLNAIDYLRGHRMALVWLGHRLSELRHIRSNSIGAERGPNSEEAALLFEEIQKAMCPDTELVSRHAAMVARYSEDIYRMMSEVARVLRPGGKAILVVGNSCLKGTFIHNSDGIIRAGAMVGLRLTRQIERDLPMNRRYLPPPCSANNPLSTRMRTESVISFIRR